LTQVIVGGIKSTTAAVAEQVLLFPLTSVTVSTTGFTPRFKQLKFELLKVVVATPQLSELPLFTAAAVVDPIPALFRLTVTFWQIAFGAWTSFTVTVKEQAAEPQAFVAVMVTVVVPRLKVEPEPVPEPEPVVAPESV
jgi:hydrogenase/urease accessory protein HupE